MSSVKIEKYSDIILLDKRRKAIQMVVFRSIWPDQPELIEEMTNNVLKFVTEKNLKIKEQDLYEFCNNPDDSPEGIYSIGSALYKLITSKDF